MKAFIQSGAARKCLGWLLPAQFGNNNNHVITHCDQWCNSITQSLSGWVHLMSLKLLIIALIAYHDQHFYKHKLHYGIALITNVTDFMLVPVDCIPLP